MKKLLFFFCAIVLVLFSSYTVYEKEKRISNIKLKSATTNSWVSFSDYKNAKGFVVIFSCNKCPMAKFYSQRLNQMDGKYKKLGVPVLVINSMDTLAYAEESFKLMQKKAKKEQFSFPYLQDKKQKIAKEFNATHTPQAFVIWKNKLGNFTIRYQGAIDDNAGEPDKIMHHFLTDAINELLQGKNVTIQKSESFGCRIYFRGEVQKMD
jgi:alkyl hydroperoxide reductase subunit AhpC